MKIRVCPECGQYCGRHFPGCPEDAPEDPQADDTLISDSMQTPNTGAKYDDGKPRAGLMVKDFARALAAVSHVSTMGANKYSAGSWKTVPNAKERYYDAFHRHILADAAGEANDPESGLPHLAHVAWNALALMELALTEAKKCTR